MMRTFRVLIEDLLQTFTVLIDPESAVSRIDSKWSWVLPLSVVGIGSVILGFAVLPIVLQVVSLNLPTGLPEAQLQSSLRTAVVMQKVGIVLSPLTLLMKWALGAGILYMACTILNIEVRFRRLFGLLAQCSIVTFLQELTAFTVINLRANEPQKLSDLSPALGLDLVLNGLSKPMMALVSYFSVFNIWYIIVLSLGLSFLSGCAKSKAFLATIPNWLLPLGIALGVAALGQ